MTELAAFIKKIKAMNMTTQHQFLNGVDGDIKEGKILNDEVKPAEVKKYASFADAEKDCTIGDYVACIITHKKNGTRFAYGRGKIVRPWAKGGFVCGFKKQFYVNDETYEVEDLFVWKVRNTKVDWSVMDGLMDNAYCKN